MLRQVRPCGECASAPRLAGRRAVRRLPAANAGRDPHPERPADLVQVHDLRPVQHGQVHDQAGAGLQLVQVRQRDGAQLVLVRGQPAELKHAQSEAVASLVAAQPADPDQVLQDAVRRRPGRASAAPGR
jgi:hypothetical protein